MCPKGFLFISLFFLVCGLMFTQPTIAQITVEPYGLAVAVEEGDTVVAEIVLSNIGEEAITYKLSFDEVDNEEDNQGRGPRRDQPEGRGILIAASCGWYNWDFERYFEAIDGLDYDRYRSWDDVEDVDFSDYDFMWLGNHEQEAWVRDYNNNLERVEDFVDRGGALYHSSGTNLHNTRPINPGGLVYTWGEIDGDRSQNNIPIQLDPEENFLINYMNENDPFDWAWGEGQRLVGGGCAHGVLLQENIDELENTDWVQTIVRGNPVDEPVLIVYQYGRGICIASTIIDGYLHNTPQNFQWGRTGEAIIWYLDYLSKPAWLLAEPNDGEIAGGEDQVIELSFIPPDDFEPGVYEMIIGVVIGDADLPSIEISAVMTYEGEVSNINGSITRSDNGDPIQNAEVSVADHHYKRWSDENGEFTLENIPVGAEFDVFVIADDFLLYEESIRLDEAGDIDWNISLLHATCEIDEDEIDYAVEPNFVQDGIEFNISNHGDGPLSWSVERHLLGDADADPWELRQELAAGAEVEDSYLSGVVYIDGLYYVSGGNSREAENFIYVLNEEGVEIERFPQFNESVYGMRDLAWDGELIWGGDGNVVYGFTPEGDLRVEFEVAIDPARAIAWDSENGILWVTSVNTPIYGYDRQGNQVGMIRKQEGIDFHGISYYPEDPDGFYLYVFTREGVLEEDSDTRVYKLNPDDGEIRFVEDLGLEVGRAGGLYITSLFDIYSWVYIGIVENLGNTPDVLNVWQIDVKLGWMEIQPTEGVIEPGESQQIDMTLIATDLPVADFEGELVFVHDGVGSETHLPVVMRVTDGPVQTFRNLNLNFGWNMMSLNVIPNDSNVVNLMEPLAEAGDLVIMKNGAGQFYRPDPNDPFNNIPGWFVDEAYMIKVHRDTRLRIEGMSIEADEVIALSEGWNLASYYPRRSVESTVALSGLVETGHLQIVKDGLGHFYIPGRNFSNIGVMREGRGYHFRVDADIDLSYLQALPEGAIQANLSIHRHISSSTKHLPEVQNTGFNMSMLLTADQFVSGEIGVYAGDRLVGTGVLEDGYCGVAIWGDDPTTTEIDGALDNELLTVRLVDGISSRTLAYSSLTGSASYQTDSFWAIELEESETAVPESFGLEYIYPNPFNSQAQVRFALLENGQVDLALYDLAGRLVDRLASGDYQAGFHTATINGIDLPSGMYIIQLRAEGQLAQQKITLIK